jgi:cytoskeletal protein RodZ
MLRAVRRTAPPAKTEPSLRVIPGGRAVEDDPPPAVDIAQALRGARTRRRISLERAAADTRISRKALAALEGTGPAEGLPDPPYDRYFLKEYARYLAVDPEPLISALDRREDREPGPRLGLLLVEPAPRRWPAVAVAAAGVATLAVLVFLGLTSNRPLTLAESDAAAPPAPPAAVRPDSPSGGSGGGTPVPGIRAVLRFTAPCWVQATVDGNVVMTETVPEGEVLRMRAERRLDLILGNAGGLRLTINGNAVTSGDAGEVVRLSFVWKNGRLRPV